MISRRAAMGLMTTGLSALALSTRGAFALDYPTRPVRFVVGYPAGGATDILARLVGQRLSERLGQQFVIENKPGAGTNFGADAVARAEPDGYTLLLGDSATFATNRTLYRKLPFDPDKSFTPISLTGRFALVLLVNSNRLPVTFAEALKVDWRLRSRWVNMT